MQFKDVIDKADKALSLLKLDSGNKYTNTVTLVNATLELLQLAFFQQSLESAVTKAKEDAQSNVPTQEEIAEFRATMAEDAKATPIQANLPLDNS